MIVGKRGVRIERPAIMGILNVTPDSFSDGGMYLGGNALEHALEMIDDGADIIDVGGESTRPGSDPVSSEEEIRRIVPVIRELSAVSDVPISVDTMKTEVAEAALDAGADMINDVNGLRAPGMAELAASADVPVIIMHMEGMPKTMQDDPLDAESFDDVVFFLSERFEYALDCGVKRIITDPGIGFGKTSELNELIIDNALSFSFGCPVLIGASRKRFLSDVYPGMDRDEATVRASMRALDSGADILRVHNVRMMADALSDHLHKDAYGQDGDE